VIFSVVMATAYADAPNRAAHGSGPILCVMSVARVLLAPGASGGVDRLRPHEHGLRQRGLNVRLIELPRGSVERAIPVFRAAIDEEVEAPPIIGGHSFGGRVASLIAADRAPPALVLLSYPLHAPGRSERWDERTAHWPRIACPVLLLSGESDPFARIELLRGAVGRLPNATLVTYPGIGHGLEPVLDAALDEVGRFVAQHT
jgi:predicted alpha/beta-hydrolase family hydrolase